LGGGGGRRGGGRGEGGVEIARDCGVGRDCGDCEGLWRLRGIVEIARDCGDWRGCRVGRGGEGGGVEELRGRRGDGLRSRVEGRRGDGKVHMIWGTDKVMEEERRGNGI